MSTDVSVCSDASGLSDALSVDAASFNESTKGTKVKASGVTAEYVYIGNECCRAKFTTKGSSNASVCGNVAPCPRPGHNVLRGVANSKGQEGFYKPEGHGRFLDGIAGTFMTIEAYQDMAKELLDANREAVEELTAKGGTTSDYGEEDMDLKLPAFDTTPERMTVSSKTETLLDEVVNDGYDSSIHLQGDWASGRGILKKKGTPAKVPPTFLPAKPPPAANLKASGAGLKNPETGLHESMLEALLVSNVSLNDAVAGLVSELKDLKEQGSTTQRMVLEDREAAQAKAQAAQVKAQTAPVKAQAPARSGSQAKATAEPPQRHWYAVAVGHIPGVYNTYAEAAAQTLGYPGNVHQRFSSWAEAVRFVEEHEATMEAIARADRERAALAAKRQAARDREAAAAKEAEDTTPESSSDFRMQGEPGVPTLDIPPPVPHFLGTDPSVGQPREVFGHQLGTEPQLRNRLSPRGLLTEDQVDLTACMIDATASPGMSSTLDSDTATDMENVTAAIKDLTEGRNSKQNSAIKPDSQWKSVTRNSLRQGLASDEALQKLYDVTQRLQLDVIGNMNTLMVTVFDKYYWKDDIKQYWAQGNLFFRISSDSLDNFLALMSELLRVSRTYGWEYAKVSVEYHSEKLTEIRGTSISRLNALVSIYIYLRDSRRNHFNNPALQEKRNVNLFNEVARLEKSVCLAISPKCPKCGGDTRVHDPGRSNCPFKNLKDSEARKRAAAVEAAYQPEE